MVRDRQYSSLEYKDIELELLSSELKNPKENEEFMKIVN